MSTKFLTITTVLFGSLALAACGGSSGDTPDSGPIIFADAGSGVDGGSIAVCNPVENTGCAPGEKCSKLDHTDMLSATACVPDGTVAVGDACEWGDPGIDTGFDNCVAKSYCRNNICREICDSEPDTCSSGNCVLIHETFDETPGVGICGETCNPVEQDCAALNEACYLDAISGKASCSRIPEETAGLGQDDDCYGPEPGTCFRNGCSEGFQSFLAKGGPDGPGGRVCAAFCTPTAQDSLNSGDLGGLAPHTCGAGGAPLGYECRFLNSWFNNTQATSETVGMCVPPLLWGSCADYDLTDMDTFVLGCQPSIPMASQPGGEKYPEFIRELRRFERSLTKK